MESLPMRWSSQGHEAVQNGLKDLWFKFQVLEIEI